MYDSASYCNKHPSLSHKNKPQNFPDDGIAAHLFVTCSISLSHCLNNLTRVQK